MAPHTCRQRQTLIIPKTIGQPPNTSHFNWTLIKSTKRTHQVYNYHAVINTVIIMNSVHPCCSRNKPVDVHHNTTTTCLSMLDQFGLQKYQSKSLRIYLPHFSSNDRTMESQAHCAYLSKRNCKNEPLQKALSYTTCDRGRVRYTPSLAPEAFPEST